MEKSKTAILHYTAPPIIGGVEGVIQAHARVFDQFGYPLTVIAGRGDTSAFPSSVVYLEMPEIDSQHPGILEITNDLKNGHTPSDFDRWVERFITALAPVMSQFDHLILHNLLTKQYNLPLTTALFRMLDTGNLPNTIAWVHDIAWTSENSSRHLHDGYPWDLLKTYHKDLTYVTVSKLRQHELAGLFDCELDDIHVIYNGVDTDITLNLNTEGQELIQRLNLITADLLILMPVRVTRLKNIEYSIRVLAELKNHFKNPRLVLTGPPDPHNQDSKEYFHQLQELRKEVGVEQEMRFVYESGPLKDEGYEIGLDIVGDLYRISDLLLMPSHSEGFGMPILEAGLVGIPVFTSHIPAADEIGRHHVHFLDINGSPSAAAALIAETIQSSSTSRMRREVRQNYTWQSIFLKKIAPLITVKENVSST
jgi:mannosylglucosylglycerate synthase